jgi:uncharacterized protein (TIRG00374 family)
MSGRQRLIVVAGIAISAIFLLIAFNGLNPGAVWTHIQAANPFLILFACAWFFVSTYVIALRWQSLMRAVKPVSVGELFQLVCITYMGNNVYPLRAGEALRVALLSHAHKIPIARNAMIVLLERLFDALVMVTFIIGGLLFVPIADERVKSAVNVLAPLFVVALAAFFVVALRPELLRTILGAVTRILPGKLGHMVENLGEDVIAGLGCLRSPADLFKGVFYSYLSWLLGATVYWIVAYAFNLTVDFPTMVLMVGLINLAGLIPASPGQFGVFESLGKLVLMAVGAAETQAVAVTLAIHIVIWLPVTILGFIFLARRGLGWNAIAHAGDLQNEAKAAAS